MSRIRADSRSSIGPAVFVIVYIIVGASKISTDPRLTVLPSLPPLWYLILTTTSLSTSILHSCTHWTVLLKLNNNNSYCRCNLFVIPQPSSNDSQLEYGWSQHQYYWYYLLLIFFLIINISHHLHLLFEKRTLPGTPPLQKTFIVIIIVNFSWANSL